MLLYLIMYLTCFAIQSWTVYLVIGMSKKLPGFYDTHTIFVLRTMLSNSIMGIKNITVLCCAYYYSTFVILCYLFK